MYLNHWNLREQPFQNVADPRFAYLADQHQEALARLVYVVRNKKLGTVLTGAYGVGKSMILELLARHDAVADTGRFVRFDAPPDGAADLARLTLDALEADRPFANPSAALEIIRTLIERPKEPFPHTTLVIDEAHALQTPAALEFLQRLTNFLLPDSPDRPGRQPAFSLILCGLPELMSLLARHKPFLQRLTMLWRLDPLDAHQTQEYVAFRMRAAGGDIYVFEEESLVEAAAAAGGIPRLINHICDAALMLGFAEKAPRINVALMRQAIAEVNRPELLGEPAAPPESEAP